MSAPPKAPFPSAPQAVLLVLALFLAEVLVSALLYDLRAALGLSEDGVTALAMLLGNALVLSLAMRHAGQGWREVFHPSPASPAVTAVLLLPPVLALVPAGVLLMGQLMAWLEALAPLSPNEEAMFQRYASGSLPMAVSVCLLAPMLEEILFRGLVLPGLLARHPPRQAIVGSALLFGAAHMNLYQFVVGLLLGLVLGWLYERSRSLIPCIALHGGYNALLMAGGADGAAPERSAAPVLGAGDAWALALPLAAAGAWGLWRVLRRR